MISDLNNLEKKIYIFRENFEKKDYPIIYIPNKFDLFLGHIFYGFKYVYSNYLEKMIFKRLQFIKKIFLYNFKIVKNFNKINRKIERQEKIIKEAFNENKDLSNQIKNLDQKLDKIFKESLEHKNYQFEIKNNNESNLSSNNLAKTKTETNNREEFYQDENVRLSSQLHETKKKFEILKEELEKHVSQRSTMIDKINSLNDEMNNSNIVTNVFNNDLEKPIINVVDHNIIKKDINDKSNKINLNEEVASIFGKK
tara:strand:+ start:72 stop:833 length:762 start_codon:yes stop_codon:yes gene_type:complete